MIMIRKGEPPRKQTTPLGNNTKKPKNVAISETKSTNSYESIKERIVSDAGMRNLI